MPYRKMKMRFNHRNSTKVSVENVREESCRGMRWMRIEYEILKVVGRK